MKVLSRRNILLTRTSSGFNDAHRKSWKAEMDSTGTFVMYLIEYSCWSGNWLRLTNIGTYETCDLQLRLITLYLCITRGMYDSYDLA